jgi:hypothetical protein
VEPLVSAGLARPILLTYFPEQDSEPGGKTGSKSKQLQLVGEGSPSEG